MAKTESSEETYFLKVNHDWEHNVVVVSANENMLAHLQSLIQDLIDNKTPGRHYHLDESSGLEGNISGLIIVRA